MSVINQFDVMPPPTGVDRKSVPLAEQLARRSRLQAGARVAALRGATAEAVNRAASNDEQEPGLPIFDQTVHDFFALRRAAGSAAVQRASDPVESRPADYTGSATDALRAYVARLSTDLGSETDADRLADRAQRFAHADLMLQVAETTANDAPDTELLERVLSGLRRM